MSTAPPATRPAVVHQAFERHARTTPQAPAARLGEREVSFADLDRMANALAHRLLNLGLESADPVVVWARPAVETLAAILAVLKAGGAYVPLGTGEPAPRLAAQIDDARPRAVLSVAADRDRFAGPAVAWVDAAAPPGDDSDPSLPADRARPCAVFYTSGSTGRPKGVVLEHRAVLNQLTWVDRTLLGGPGTALPVVNRLTFAASLKQVFVPWLRGEPVWLLDEATASDPVALAGALAGHPRVLLNCVPHLWQGVLDAVEAGAVELPAGLAAVALAGEAPSRSLVDSSFAAAPNLALWNLYGATELGIGTAARLAPGEPPRLGRPIANVTTHVLDDDLRPTGTGEPGRLHVGGAGLARGYLRDPALTAQRFVADPFSDDAGARLFRTDDLVRRGADGELEFLERRDVMVKVRGMRIDPREVEEAIARHPLVAAAAVSAHRDDRGRERLVAHVVGARTEPPPGVGDLRGFLAAQLPPHMLPSRVIAVSGLPTTSSGKLDRSALTSSGLPQADGRASRPANRLERRVVKAWRDVLEVDRVAATDDFFELGGDSLSALRLAAELERRTGVPVAPSAFLEAPTPESLAKLIARTRPGDEPSSLIAIRSTGTLEPLFCVAPAPATVMPIRRLAAHIDHRRPVYALQAYGLEDDGGAPVEAVARRYVAAIRGIQPEGPYLLAGQCLGAVIALEAAQQLRSARQEVALLAVFDALPLPTRLATEPRRGRPGRRPGNRRLRRARRRVARVVWHAPRRRVRPVWRALRSAHEVGSLTPATVRALRRQAARQYVVLDAYRAAPYAGRIEFFMSAGRTRSRPGKYDAGWEAVAGGGLARTVIPGGHHDLLGAGVAEVAARLETRLAAIPRAA